jgi:hypothetical protein
VAIVMKNRASLRLAMFIFLPLRIFIRLLSG